MMQSANIQSNVSLLITIEKCNRLLIFLQLGLPNIIVDLYKSIFILHILLLAMSSFSSISHWNKSLFFHLYTAIQLINEIVDL